MGYGYVQPRLAALQSSAGKTSLAELFNIPFIVPAFLAAALMVAVLFGLERWRSWRKELGNDYDGYFTRD